MERHCLIVLLFGVLSSTIGSPVKPTEELNREETVIYLKEKMRQMDVRFLLLENHLLREVLQLKRMLIEAVEKVQMTELTSKLSLTDILNLQLNEDLTFGLENTHSNLTAKLRSAERDEVLRMKDTVRNHSVQLKRLDESVKGVRCELNYTRGASDCSDILQMGCTKSGVYKIWPSRMTQDRPLEVYCDMQTDGGGWTLIQRRGNFGKAADYFYQDWKTYKKGFGDIEKEFWLGNDNIFALTNQKNYSVRFDLRDVEYNTAYALYDTFRIEDENHKYRLHIDGYTGDAGDSMTSFHNNWKFSTKDQDNDSNRNLNCANFKGGWWYSNCYLANVNGEFVRNEDSRGVLWMTWRAYSSLESTEIKIRPRMFNLPNV